MNLLIKHSRFILATILSFSGIGIILSVFSGPLGLGLREEFFFDKHLFLQRNQLLTLSIFLGYCVFTFILSLLLSQSKPIQSYVKNKLFIPFLLLSSSLFHLILDFKNHTFGGDHLGDFLISYKLLNPEFLNNDFIVSGLISSPKLFFGYFLTLLNIFNISPLLFAEYLSVFGHLTCPTLVYLIIKNLIKLWTPPSYSKYNMCFIQFFLLFILLFIYWVPIACFLLEWNFIFVKNIAYSTLFSYYLGLVFLYFYSTNKYIICYFVFILATLFNPVTGICFLIMWSLFFLIKNKNYSHFFILSTCLMSTLLYIFFKFKSNIMLSASQFIDIYIYDRHYFLYDLTRIFDYKYVLVGLMLLIPIFFIRNRDLKWLFSCSFLCYFLSIFTHYLFIEVIPTKLFAKLTPLRFVRHSFFIILMLYFIVLSRLSSSKIAISRNVLLLFQPFVSFFEYLFRLSHHSYMKITLYLLILSAVIFLPIYRHSIIEQSVMPDYQLFKNWLKKNTSKDDVFLVLSDTKSKFYKYEVHLLSDSSLASWIRIFGKRSIYWSSRYPFNDDFTLLWFSRKKQLKKIYKDPNILKDATHFGINYIIVPKDMGLLFEKSDPTVIFNQFLVYNLHEL